MFSSSLQRIISSNAALQNDVKEIKSYIARNTSLIAQTSSLFGVKDEVFKASLSAALMKNAEALGPWSTIGINEWIETGRWWLIRVCNHLPYIQSFEGQSDLIKHVIVSFFSID